MKKNYLCIVFILVLLVVVIVIILSNFNSVAIDFNTNLKLSNNSNNILSSLTSEEYAIDEVEDYELPLEDEEEIIELVYNMTYAFNDIDGNIGDAEDKYYIREPFTRIEYMLFMDENEEYETWLNNLAHISMLSLFLYDRSYTFEEIKDVAITYVSSNRVFAEAYIEDYIGYYGDDKVTIDAIFQYEIVYEEESSMYKIKSADIVWVRDLEDYFTANDTSEREQNNSNSNALSNVSTFIPSGFTTLDYSKLEELDESTANTIYEKNKDSVVIIDSSNESGVTTGSSTGFFIRSGIVVTSYDSFLSMINNGASHYYAVDSSDNIYNIEGVVAVYSSINVVILKLESEVGTSVTIGTSDSLEEGDPVATISSSIGLKSSIKLGIYVETLDDDYKIIRTSLPLINGDSGSPLFNLSGEVIGINTSVSTDTTYNSGVNNAVDISILESVIEYINNQEFTDITSTSISSLTEEEVVESVNKVSDSDWEKYLALPAITDYYSIDLYSAYSSNNYIIVRYKQSDYTILDNDTIISLYGKYLEENSYIQISENTYSYGNITIRLKNNLGFIIVIVSGV